MSRREPKGAERRLLDAKQQTGSAGFARELHFSCCLSIWHPTAEGQAGDTERQAGDTTPEPASQHLAFDRRDWETQGDKRETRPRRHAAAETGRHVTASSIRPQRLGDTGRQAGDTTPEPASHPTAETGRQAGHMTPEPASQHLASRHRETSGRHDPGARVTASGI